MAISVQSNPSNAAAMAYQTVQSRPQAASGQVSRPDVKPTATPSGTAAIPTGSVAPKAISNATKPAATLELSEAGRKLAEQTKMTASSRVEAATITPKTDVSQMASVRTNSVQNTERSTQRVASQAVTNQTQTATKVAIESKQSSGRASRNGFSQIG